MFQFPGLPYCTYGFSTACIDITLCGFSHSDIHESAPACGSSWLFAAYRVLLRLLVPRHPPYALIRLTSVPAVSLQPDLPLTILRMYHQCLFSTFVSSLAKKLSFSICSVGNCFYLLQKNFSIIHCVVFKEPCPALFWPGTDWTCSVRSF